jgi:glutamate--cysteine ligase
MLKDAVEHFRSCFRTDLRQRDEEPRWVGIENEYPLVSSDGTIIKLEILEYLWQELASRGWEIVTDETSRKVVAVKKEREQLKGKKVHQYDLITTDLGYATLEIDLAPTPSLKSAQKHLYELIEMLTSILSKRDVYLLGYGIQPVAAPQPAYIGQKSRYSFMIDMCDKENEINPGGYRVDLHTVDASCQTHVEVSAEEAIPVVNALNATSGLRIALLANSSIWLDQLAEYKAMRLMFVDWCWPSRKQQLGMPPKFQSIDHYVDYIFDFRSIAVRRNNVLYKLNNHSTFRHFFFDDAGQMGTSLDGEKVRVFGEIDDIKSQCGFAWFNARLQAAYGTVEDRISCQQPPFAHLCASALTLGLVENYKDLMELVDTFSLDQWRDIHFLACKYGLDFSYPGVDVHRQIERMLSIAEQGLRARALGEEVYLEPLYERIATRCCPADDARMQFLRGGVAQIVSHYRMSNIL